MYKMNYALFTLVSISFLSFHILNFPLNESSILIINAKFHDYSHTQNVS